MGASHSTDYRPSPEQQEQESLANSTGFFTFLKSAFARLSVPQSQCIPLSSLQLSLSVPSVTLGSASSISAPDFPLLPHVGPASSELLFAAGKDGTDWTAFLQGYNKCCARMSASCSFNLLCRLFYGVCRRAGIASPLDFDQKDAEGGKVEGRMEAGELLMLLWLCWVMEQSPRIAKRGGGEVFLPDLSQMLLSAFVACGEVVDDDGLWDFDCLQSGKSVSLQKLCVWLLTTAPGLLNCFPYFLREKIRAIAVSGVSRCIKGKFKQ
ncbi:hypothetical protein HPP92_014497 [Vanilla planifolia]|uniref:Uncharacterized protein n=1 Tax=Vanilla planifolia TaxID=51239 RepID=A0A835QPL1_VANPL|nr:hypothetical protein HPP92_014497 [Vanilla planifolia]